MECSTTNALVFNIQKFCLHDGPGIRTTVFLKGCPLQCLWCCNPEGITSYNELMYVTPRCVGCKSCVSICPRAALKPSEDDKVEIDRSKCNNCGMCTDVCPSEALRMSAHEMTVEEVMAEVRKDRIFYELSGGGITLSGGEPLSHPFFAVELLKQCKKEGINTALETSGYSSPKTLKEVLHYVDYLLYDVKHTDPKKHEVFTGKSNEIILKNLEYITSIYPVARLTARVPLIPGFNDSSEEVLSIVGFVASLGIKNVDVLPFHKLGASKYKYLGRDFKLDAAKTLNPKSEQLLELKELIEGKFRGIKARVGG